MDHDEPGWQLLDDFFAHVARGRATGTVRRHARVRARLTHFLDTADMTRGLGADRATLLAAERQFHERGAFWQLFGPDELVRVLPGALLAPWLPDGLAEARSQISLVSRLTTHLRRHRLLDLTVSQDACTEVEVAVQRAHLDLRTRALAREPDPWAGEMPARLRRQPGPRW